MKNFLKVALFFAIGFQFSTSYSEDYSSYLSGRKVSEYLADIKSSLVVIKRGLDLAALEGVQNRVSDSHFNDPMSFQEMREFGNLETERKMICDASEKLYYALQGYGIGIEPMLAEIIEEDSDHILNAMAGEIAAFTLGFSLKKGCEFVLSGHPLGVLAGMYDIDILTEMIMTGNGLNDEALDILEEELPNDVNVAIRAAVILSESHKQFFEIEDMQEMQFSPSGGSLIPAGFGEPPPTDKPSPPIG